MTASGARVRLSPAETIGSAASRTRTFSRCCSEDGSGVADGTGSSVRLFGNTDDVGGLSCGPGPKEGEDLRSFVARLEITQAQCRSPHQPTASLDAELRVAISLRPEWRARMATATKSANLRQKILAIAPHGQIRSGKMLSFAVPAEKLAYHPLLSSSACYSIPQRRRFPGTIERSGEVDATECQQRGTPGPGAYIRSQPRGTAFSVDGGETVILGANHTCPWKKCLGRNINPVHADGTSLKSSPSWSFSKLRRTVSDTSLGYGGPNGWLSPGPVYEHHSTLRPASWNVSVTAGSVRRRPKSSSTHPKIRIEPVPVDVPPDPSAVPTESDAAA